MGTRRPDRIPTLHNQLTRRPVTQAPYNKPGDATSHSKWIVRSILEQQPFLAINLRVWNSPGNVRRITPGALHGKQNSDLSQYGQPPLVLLCKKCPIQFSNVSRVQLLWRKTTTMVAYPRSMACAALLCCSYFFTTLSLRPESTRYSGGTGKFSNLPLPPAGC